MNRFLVVICLSLLALVGCKKTPVDPPVLPEPQADGGYVGWGRPGGTGQNVWLEIAQPDTGGWLSRILYGGSLSDVLVTDVSEGEDTVRFEYSRGNTYRCLGVVTGYAITIYILEPAGQPTYTLNRETAGLNLSGEWHGRMFSQLLGDWRDAELFVDQQGSLFDGDLEAHMTLYDILGDVNDGAQEGVGFFVSGLTPIANADSPFRLDGSYVTRDSLAGMWQIALPNGQDAGDFAFLRRF